MRTRPKMNRPFKTRAFDLGQPLISLDNVAEALANLEGEGFR